MSRPWAFTAIALVFLGWRAHAGQPPSVVSLRLDGRVERGPACRLTCRVKPGDRWSAKLQLSSLTLERYADDGALTVLSCEEPQRTDGRVVADVVDRDVARGRTYRYQLVYDADVRLRSELVVLSVPRRGHRWREPGPEPSVEIATPLVVGAGSTCIIRAHCTTDGATYVWRSLTPHSLAVLASVGDAALVRVEDVVGYAACGVEVRCAVGDAHCSDRVQMPTAKMYMTTRIKVDAKRVAAGRADPSVVADELRRTYGKTAWVGVTLNRTDEFIERVGRAALPPLREFVLECERPGVRYHLIDLMARIDRAYILRVYRDDVLEGTDPFLATALLWIASAAYRDGGDARDAERLLLRSTDHPDPIVRQRATRMLGRLATRRALSTLERVRCADPVGRIRLVAARARLKALGEKPDVISQPPMWQREVGSEDASRARALLTQSVEELSWRRQFTRHQTSLGPGGLTDQTVSNRLEFWDDFDVWVRPLNALPKLALFGHAAAEVTAESMLDSEPSRVHMAMMRWALEKADLELPRRVWHVLGRRVHYAQADAREERFGRFLRARVAWVPNSGFKEERFAMVRRWIASGDAVDRLCALADVAMYVQRTNWRAVYKSLESNTSTPWDIRARRLALDLREGHDAASQLARDRWPVPPGDAGRK